MDIFEATHIVVRWWFVTLPVLLAAVIIAAMLSTNIQPEYRATASVFIAGPKVREVDDLVGSVEPVNPLLNQPSALSTTAVLAMLAARSPESRRALAADGLSTAYEVEIHARSPILLMTTRARTRQLATSTTLRLIELVDRDLQARQDAVGVPDDQQVTANLLELGSVGGADHGGRTRLRVLIVGFGAGLSVVAALLLDALRTRLNAPRAARDVMTGGRAETPGVGMLRRAGGGG